MLVRFSVKILPIITSSEEYIRDASSFIMDNNFSLLGKAPNTSKYTKENSNMINKINKVTMLIKYFNKRFKVLFCRIKGNVFMIALNDFEQIKLQKN